MLRGASKPTPAQRQRRIARVVALTNQGYWVEDIAQSLVPPIALGTVSQDRAAGGRDITVRTKGKHKRPRGKPEPYDWMSEPPPPPAPPAHWVTGPLPRLEGLRDYLVSNNARNQFSFNVREAIARNDVAFMQKAKEVIAELSGYIDDLAEITVSEAAMNAAAEPEARDDLRRIVPRGWTDPTNEKPLPTFGTGTIPTRYHAALWQLWWSGENILDPAVITKVATQQRSGRDDLNVARVRRAAVELLSVLRPPA